MSQVDLSFADAQGNQLAIRAEPTANGHSSPVEWGALRVRLEKAVGKMAGRPMFSQ